MPVAESSESESESSDIGGEDRPLNVMVDLTQDSSSSEDEDESSVEEEMEVEEGSPQRPIDLTADDSDDDDVDMDGNNDNDGIIGELVHIDDNMWNRILFTEFMQRDVPLQGASYLIPPPLCPQIVDLNSFYRSASWGRRFTASLRIY